MSRYRMTISDLRALAGAQHRFILPRNLHYLPPEGEDLPCGTMAWVGAHPGLSDSPEADPELLRVIEIARRHAKRLLLVNLWPFRADCREPLRGLPADPRRWNGRWNGAAIKLAIEAADGVVLAWGDLQHEASITAALATVGFVLRVGYEPLCLGVTSAGQPKHPLYCLPTTPLIPFRSSSEDPKP